MARPDGRLEPGQPLRGAISARAWNRAQDAADIVLGARSGIAGVSDSPVLKPYTWAYCKASTAVERWGILEITGVEIAPAGGSGGATASFEDMPVLTGGEPNEDTTAWCVAIEPIESGKIGRVAVSGVVQCKVEIANASDSFVMCQSSTSELKSGSSGEGLILWKESGTGGDKWALVRLGHDRPLVRGTFSGNWDKDGTKEVTDAVATGVTYEAKNYIVSLGVTGTVTCCIAYVAGEWVLVSWDWHQISEWTQTAQQVLTHDDSGKLKWVGTTDCDA